ncbi:MAG TPA: nicotinate-nicotinamide nucleotide adenylyltransferase [Acholeplasmataceae bacterium]|nr:nicotinate-nicotinamide nucleotide adenylyltransferase [Acholeplasmataceae bacterium]
MKILYGGSFNPPTLAHYQIAEYLLEKFPEAELHFLPANNFYEKDNLKDFRERFEMLEILCRRLGPRAKVNGFEGGLDRYYGTWYTLKHFPDAWFVIGADNLVNLPTWINYPAVVRENRFLVIPRPAVDIEEAFLANPMLSENRQNFHVLTDFPETGISSTLYRQTKDERLLLPEVADYIRKNDLYKE